MSIASSQGVDTARRGLSPIGDLLGALPSFEGGQLDAIEHLPGECDRARYNARITIMMEQFPDCGRKPVGRKRRRALLDILETFARQAPISVNVPPIVWKYLHVASAKICARDADWDSKKGPLIAASNDHLRLVLGWNAARTNLARLAEYGFAVPYCLAANGKRYLGAGDDGRLDDASGWSLGPLLLLEDYLVELAGTEEQLRRQHVELPRRIRRATAAAYRIVRAFEHETWAETARKKLAAIAEGRRLYGRRRVSVDAIRRLERLADASERLIERLVRLVSCEHRQLLTEASDTRVQLEQHHQYSPDSALVSVDGLAERRSGDVVSPTSEPALEEKGSGKNHSFQSPRIEDDEDPFGIERSGFSWSEAPALFPFIDGLIEFPERPGLDQLHALARMSQIGHATAARASGRIGTEAAILCVLITAHHLHAGEIRKTPDAYMAALVKRAAIGELNIGHTLFGRREAIYGRRETKSSVRVNTMPRSSH